MGFYNAQAVEAIAAAKGIGHAAARLANHIALVTLDYAGRDGQVPRLYFAGRDAMAIGLGYLVAQYDDTPEGIRAKRAAYGAVKRALRELTDNEIVELVQAGNGHRASVYRLLVPEVLKPATRPRDLVDARYENPF